MAIPQNINIKLLYDPAIPLLGIFLKELRAETQRNTYIPMFIAALLTITKAWKHLECPLTNE